MTDEQVKEFVGEILDEMITWPRGTTIRAVLLHRRLAQGDVRAAEVLALPDAAFPTPGFLDTATER